MSIKLKSKVLITTKHRGLFFGTMTDRKGDLVTLENARCAIRFGTTEGFLELAKTGPTGSSKIGAVAPKIELYDVTSVTEVTPEAAAAWEAAK